MLVGYVGDERYVALPDVLLEFESEAGSVEARSRASGAVYANVAPGPYRVTLSKEGFGGKRVQVVVRDGEPYQFRLLSDGLLGWQDIKQRYRRSVWIDTISCRRPSAASKCA